MFSGLVVGLSFWYVLADLGCFLVRPAIKKRLSRFRLELRARFVTGSGRFCNTGGNLVMKRTSFVMQRPRGL